MRPALLIAPLLVLAPPASPHPAAARPAAAEPVAAHLAAAQPAAAHPVAALPAAAQPAAAQPAPALPAAAQPAAAAQKMTTPPPITAVRLAADPAKVCTIKDSRLDELSGISRTGDDGYVVVNDGSDHASHRKIFFLDDRCRVTRTVSYPSRPRDTEDLARAADGTIWIADVGDNGRTRETVGLWRLAPGAKTPVLHRVTYPDGAHDAEALLLTSGGDPVIVTKDPGTAGLYLPAKPLSRSKPVPLRQAGQFTIPQTFTSNPFSFLGRTVVTGGAVSPDGRRVALRTYADAFEFDVPDGDVIRAVTTGKPRLIALPDEPQGESLAYSDDAGALLTVSETTDRTTDRPAILRYALPSAGDPPATAGTAPSPATLAGSAPAATTPNRRTPYLLVLAAAVTGLILVAAGLVALRRRSR